MKQVWGHCPQCSRWFTAQVSAVGAAPACEICDTPADHLAGPFR
jgi:hypothetical protein